MYEETEEQNVRQEREKKKNKATQDRELKWAGGGVGGHLPLTSESLLPRPPIVKLRLWGGLPLTDSKDNRLNGLSSRSGWHPSDMWQLALVLFLLFSRLRNCEFLSFYIYCCVFLINCIVVFLFLFMIYTVVPKQSSPVLVTNIHLADNRHYVIDKIATQTGCRCFSSSVEGWKSSDCVFVLCVRGCFVCASALLVLLFLPVRLRCHFVVLLGEKTREMSQLASSFR